MDDLGEKKSPFGGEIIFSRLFPFCSLFAEDKGRRRLEVGNRQRRQMKSEETKEPVFMEMP